MAAPHPRPEPSSHYDPWLDVARNWPEVEVVLEPMAGRLLGELRYPTIALRAGSSAAQRRCTLAHELVHLERGGSDCGPWATREERLVHAEATRRLIRPAELERALRELGGDADLAALAQLLDVDTQTVRVRLELLTARDRARVQARVASELWGVA